MPAFPEKTSASDMHWPRVMKTRHGLLALVTMALASCVGAAGSESIGSRAAPGDEPGRAEPCDADVCADGSTLRVCGADGTFFEDIDCSVNRGSCQRRGQRDMCVADGWDCQTRCVDEHTLQICWSDLSVTTSDCEDAVCVPDGAYDPLTGDTTAVCVGEPPANVDCACDTFNTDPALPMCCDEGCDCDVDCDTGLPVCGAEGDGDGEAAGGEDCACDSWFSDPTAMCCDEGCACDLDCDLDAPACGSDDGWDSGDDGDGFHEPDGWTCLPSFYDAGDGCDCDCGVLDPDCADPNQDLFGCAEGEICDAQGFCAQL